MRTFSLSRDQARHKSSLLSEYTENLGMAMMRRKSMLALKAARLEAEMSLKARTEFVASMSHELRTPLNAIIGFSDMLRNRPMNDPQQVQEYAGYINDAARHLLELINQVLDISKVHAGRMELSPALLQINDMVNHAVQLMQPRVAEKGLTLHCRLADDMPEICADETRLRQVLLNLLSNAVKFTPEGGEISVLTEWREQQRMACIEVRDTGTGMTPQEVARAREPFEQIHDQLNKKHEGTGLGLPISIALVELHGGNLEIESAKGRGTTVRVLLPVGNCGKSPANGPTAAGDGHGADSGA